MRNSTVAGLSLVLAGLCARSAGQEIQPRSILKGHTSPVYCVAVAPDGKTLASGSRDGVVICWDVREARPKWTVQAHADNGNRYTQVLSVAFSPDGTMLASGGWDQTVKLWHALTGEPKRMLPHENLVYSVAFSPDGKTLASGEHQDAIIRLWDVRTGHLKAALSGGRGSVWSLAFSPDGKTLASGAYRFARRGFVQLWDLTSGRVKLEIDAPGTVAVAFSPDAKRLASTGTQQTGERGQSDAVVRLWDAQTGELKRTWKVEGDDRTVAGSVAFSPDGRLVASGSAVGERAKQKRPGTLYLWDVGTGRLLWEQVCHDGDVTSLAFLPDGKTLVSGSRDKTVKLWEITRLLRQREE